MTFLHIEFVCESSVGFHLADIPISVYRLFTYSTSVWDCPWDNHSVSDLRNTTKRHIDRQYVLRIQHRYIILSFFPLYFLFILYNNLPHFNFFPSPSPRFLQSRGCNCRSYQDLQKLLFKEIYLRYRLKHMLVDFSWFWCFYVVQDNGIT